MRAGYKTRPSAAIGAKRTTLKSRQATGIGKASAPNQPGKLIDGFLAKNAFAFVLYLSSCQDAVRSKASFSQHLPYSAMESITIAMARTRELAASSALKGLHRHGNAHAAANA
jgi:hypothetical protein